MKNVFVEITSVFTANTLTNAIAAAKSNDNTVAVNEKIGMSRKTGKLIMSIPEANETAKALEAYAKKTTHAASAKMAKSLATAIRFKTAAACKAVKAAAVAA